MIGSKHEWFNLNSIRSYPFIDNKFISSSGFILPDYMILDINIATSSEDIVPELSCINISPYIVSVAIRDASSGNDIATSTCLISNEYSTEKLEQCSSVEVNGTIVFGDLSRVKSENLYGFIKFSSGQYVIHNYCYFCTGDKVITGAAVNGVNYDQTGLEIIPSSSLKCLVSTSINSNNTEETDVLFYLSDPQNFKKICQIPETLCSCPETPIQKINTVSPDVNGNIEIIIGSYKLVSVGLIKEYQLDVVSPVSDLYIYQQDNDIILGLEGNVEKCEETDIFPFADGRLPSEANLTS